ncbi:MAG: DUF4395 domain-containing protein [Bacteroidetes bacterium]|nr:DUF4395 domain-containing protein [Bacteroidota bacterium]
MSTTDAAPEARVNENVVRLVAAQVLIFAIATIVTGWWFLPAYLISDFFVRAFTAWRTPFVIVARQIAEGLNLPNKPIYAAPKKFAAGVGFVFSILITALLLTDHLLGARVVTGILAVFAALESVFSICAGCYVYSYLVAPLVNKLNQREIKTLGRSPASGADTHL